jgi:HAD superfamily hydrolase (TIGR01490 family)
MSMGTRRESLFDRAAGAIPEVEAELVVPVDARAAAFFDVDNTMLRGASVFALARGLAARHFFSRSDLAGFAWKQAKFAVGGKENRSDMAAATQAALGFVAGREVAELVDLVEEIFDEYLIGKLWPGTLALAQTHLDAGQRVWLVTATPIELADVIAHRLGLTGALGTVSEVSEGRYIGRLLGHPMHGPAKATAVRELAIREGLELERCAAYSDSANDIPLLSMVGRPTAINPDHALRTHARTQGWPVHDYRRRRRTWRVTAPGVAAAGLAAGVGIGLAVSRQRPEVPR